MSQISQDQKKTLYILLGILFFMICLVSASVPLYSLFCQVTGYGGRTQRSEMYSDYVGQKIYKVRFNADVAKGLPWKFYPQDKYVYVRSGENALTFYYSENMSDKPVNGMAIYTVTPHRAAVYFNKVHCFCFEQQTLEAGQKVDMPVTFFIDPAIEKDKELRNVDTLTLSYMFFPYKN